MLTAFKTKKPWVAVIITLLLSPVIGMCYLNRGKAAIGYFILTLFAATAGCAMIFFGILNINPKKLIMVIGLIIGIIGAIHTYILAKNRNVDEPLKWYSKFKGMLLIWLIQLLLALLIRWFICEPFDIPTDSMSPNVNKGAYLFINKFIYGYSDPKRGDIIVFKIKNANIDYIKRIIGMPGDRIQIKQGILYINDVAVPQKEIADYQLSHQFIETLPNGVEYKILIDTIESPLNNTDVYSVPDNSYFVMGDNRDHSEDSRVMGKIGFVPKQTIAGPLSLIIWNGPDKNTNLIERADQ
jgi:signal peptidase I